MIASMWIGNLMLVIINLPLIGIWVRCCGALPADVPGDPAVLLHRHLYLNNSPSTWCRPPSSG
jgi:hypothetical protein